MSANFNRLPIQAPCALGSHMPWDAETKVGRGRPLPGRTTE
jgi:hypothetical protein